MLLYSERHIIRLASALYDNGGGGDSGDEAVCVRTSQNNMLSEALIFHSTLSTPKISYIGQFRRAHPTRELKSIHVLPPESTNEYELTILSLFHTTRVLGNYLLQHQGLECDN